MKKNFISLSLAGIIMASLLGSTVSVAQAATTETPRNQTYYFNGIQWDTPKNFNPESATPAFPIDTANSRDLLYEFLFLYNSQTGKLEGQLATKNEWTDSSTLIVTMNPAAKWNDGQPVTADDVAYTYDFQKRAKTGSADLWTYLESVTASGDKVTFKLKANPFNPLIVTSSLSHINIIPKHIWAQYEKDAKGDLEAVKKMVNDKPVGSGPYKLMFYDSTKITLVRDDNYWGKTLYGGLPAPKYISHVIYKSNDAGNLAFANGENDVSQQFIPKVWELSKKGKSFTTWFDAAPYYAPAGMPNLIFNMSNKMVSDPSVRRAIAMCIDYDKISKIAMSGYSSNLVPSIAMMNNPVESAFIDENADIKALEWKYDVDGANKLLDSIGAKKGKDGIRVLNGQRLGPIELQCPQGWSDWNASMEIIAQSAKKIGIEMKTSFPDWSVVQPNMQIGKFDVTMWTYAGALSPTQPWERAYDIMSSKDVPPAGQPSYSRNYGRYKSPEADKLLDQIPGTTDKTKLKQLYTALDKIYLQDVVTIPLMYRPATFFTTYNGVWTGMPNSKTQGATPELPCDGLGVKALYKIKAK